MFDFFSKKYGRRKGFTLIEALVLLFIFIVIITSFYRFFVAGTNLIMEAKKKLVAISVANEQIEIIRSLPYGEIAVGSVDEDLTYGNYVFHVITSIGYRDDEFDGTGGSDSSPNDYKNVIITVRWGNEGDSQTVSASSNIAPFGEEVAIGGGILNVSAVDVDGNPVGGVQVNITNSSPLYNQTLTTNANGSASFIGAPQDNQGYVVTLSKSEYEGDVTTFPPYPSTAYYPTNVHASVVNGSTTNSVFSFSRISDFKIKFINPIGDTPVPNVNFSMSGGRVMGTNPDTSLVHNYNELSLVSDASGEEEFQNMSPGQYSLDVDEAGYVFWKTDAGTGNNSNELLIMQGESGNTKNVFLLDENIDSHFVQILDLITGAPLEDTQIKIKNETLLFSDEVITDEYGYAFFPTASDKLLVNGTEYDLEISKSGYNTKTGKVTINKLTQDTISLTP